MKKVLFLTNVPSPYRVNFFNEFGKYCDLTVVFEKKQSDERDESWKDYQFKNFHGEFLKGISINTDTAISFGAKKYVKDKNFDFIIISNFSSPTGMIAVHYMKKHKIKYFIETDGGSPKSGKGFKERIKTGIIKGASGYFSTGEENDRYFLAYGADKDKIYRYPFTSIYDKDVFGHIATPEEKATFRQELGIQEKYVILSVGRFSYLNGYGKGYDVLIRAAEKLSGEIGWYIIGGQPNETFQTMLENSGLKNFHFIDFKLKDELVKYYRASDQFVLMSVGEAWGLVINESMACGLPVITTEKCIAGRELVKEGQNGYLLSVGDTDGLISSVSKIIENNQDGKMGNFSIQTIREYTIEQMAKRHKWFIENL